MEETEAGAVQDKVDIKSRLRSKKAKIFRKIITGLGVAGLALGSATADVQAKGGQPGSEGGGGGATAGETVPGSDAEEKNVGGPDQPADPEWTDKNQGGRQWNGPRKYKGGRGEEETPPPGFEEPVTGGGNGDTEINDELTPEGEGQYKVFLPIVMKSGEDGGSGPQVVKTEIDDQVKAESEQPESTVVKTKKQRLEELKKFRKEARIRNRNRVNPAPGEGEVIKTREEERREERRRQGRNIYTGQYEKRKDRTY